MNFRIELPLAREAFDTPRFETVLKSELEGVAPHRLPLQQGLVHGSVVLDAPFSAMIIATRDQGDGLQIKIGVFYSSIVAGCNCADDPTPVEALSEYCELIVALDKRTASADVYLST